MSNVRSNILITDFESSTTISYLSNNYYIENSKEKQSLHIERGGLLTLVVDKKANRELRIRHYNNYKELLDKSKIKTNAEMARKTGIYPSMFTDWSKGRCEPKAERILAIAKVLRVNPNKIID